jgi:hypothetical protein
MPETPEESLIEARSHLLPEETAAGSDNCALQAQIILQDSEDRTQQPEETTSSEWSIRATGRCHAV